MAKRNLTQRNQDYNRIQTELANFYALPISRAAIYLKEEQGKTLDDIGEILGVTRARIQTLIKRGKQEDKHE